MKIKSKINCLALAVSMALLPVTNSHAGAIVSLVTVNQNGKADGFANESSANFQDTRTPTLSPNGQYVVFQSHSNNLAPFSNDRPWFADTNIFIRDIVARKTKLISTNNTKTSSGDYSSYHPVFSANSQFITFFSEATDLTNIHENSVTQDIFSRNLKTETTQLVNINKGGMSTSPGYSFSASNDGRFIAFESKANDLVANDTNEAYDIFVRDTKNKTTKLVSINSNKTDSGNAGSSSDNIMLLNPTISPNGRFVIFASKADDLVPNDTNTTEDAFIRDLSKGKTTLLGAYVEPEFTPDSRSVVFISTQNPFVVASLTYNLLIQDLVTHKNKRLNVDKFGKTINDIKDFKLSANGRYVMFLSVSKVTSLNSLYIRDLVKNTTKLIIDNISDISLKRCLINSNGRYIIFSSTKNGLVAHDKNGKEDIFVYDLATYKSTLLTINIHGQATGSGGTRADFINKSFSPDGRFVVFQTDASDLVAHDTNNTADVFVRDLKTNKTKLISMNKTGSASGKGQSFDPVISSNGKTVLFKSTADNLVDNDSNGKTDLFTYRLQ